MNRTQVEIAKRVGLDVSSVNKILNRVPGPTFRKDTIKRVLAAAKEVGYVGRVNKYILASMLERILGTHGHPDGCAECKEANLLVQAILPRKNPARAGQVSTTPEAQAS